MSKFKGILANSNFMIYSFLKQTLLIFVALAAFVLLIREKHTKR